MVSQTVTTEQLTLSFYYNNAWCFPSKTVYLKILVFSSGEYQHLSIGDDLFCMILPPIKFIKLIFRHFKASDQWSQSRPPYFQTDFDRCVIA